MVSSEPCRVTWSSREYFQVNKEDSEDSAATKRGTKCCLYLTTFEAVKNALWLDNRGRKMLKTQATAIPKYGNIVTSGV